MAFPQVRKFTFQNTNGKLYEVVLKQAADGSVSGVGYLLGTGVQTSVPLTGITGEVSFVVLTAHVGKAFGLGAHTVSSLSQGAWFDASNPAAGGAALSTLLT